jgi:hypothetical protein
MNLNFLVIREKAVSLFKDLKLKAEEGSRVNVEDLEFKASHGWFERFKAQDRHPIDVHFFIYYKKDLLTEINLNFDE